MTQAFPLDHNVANVMFDGTLVGVDVWRSPDGQVQANARLKTQAFVDFVDYCFLARSDLVGSFRKIYSVRS